MTESNKKQMDFSPFDAEDNLKAVYDVIRTIKHMSWTYAGDINSVVKKITQTFDAGRCVVFAHSIKGGFDVFEHVEEPLASMSTFFESQPGQEWLEALTACGDDLISSERFTNLGPFADVTDQFHMPDGLTDPPTHIMPLKNQYTFRYGGRPGLLLLQEPRGLSRWSRRLLDSLVIVAEYLAMAISCERITDTLTEEDSRGHLAGVLPNRRVASTFDLELTRLKEEGKIALIVVLRVPAEIKLTSPELIRVENGIVEECAREIAGNLSSRELVGFWEASSLVALLHTSDVEQAIALVRKVQGTCRKWCEDNKVSLNTETIMTGAIAAFPEHGERFDDLVATAIGAFEE